MIGFHNVSLLLLVLHFSITASLTTALGALPPVLNDKVQLIPSDPGDLARFGVSTAIDGKKAAVVSWGFGSSPSGFYLYDQTTGQQLSQMTISQTSNVERFSNVDISGNLLLVGSQEETVDGLQQAGRALLFDITNPAQPTELLPLTAPVVSAAKNFGAELELKGTKALIGAYGGEFPLPAVPGAAYFYDLTNLNEIQVTTLIPDDSHVGDLFGASLSMDDDIAIVGGFSGSAYLFDLSTGQQLTKLQSPSLQYTEFGKSVDISGDRAIVWSRQNNPGNDSGAAHLYDISEPTNPVFLATLTGSQPLLERGYMGRVAIDGHFALLSARSADSAYLFDIRDFEKIGEARLVATNASSFSEFGISVDMDGRNIIVGAWNQRVGDQRSGAAYVFVIPEPASGLLLLLSVVATVSTRR